MRSLTPVLTPELTHHVNGVVSDLASSEAFPVNGFRALLEHIARLSHLNKDSLLFYRGQGTDYRNKSNASTFYPSIYRGDNVPKEAIEQRFAAMTRASQQLRTQFRDGHIDGHEELVRKVHVQWSILQHYEVCSTPLLDLTHSLRVACSFAEREAKEGTGFVYVFGLPYLTNRISFNSEHDLIIVRLLSICPPRALRPYFQEGYLAGTVDITTEFDSKTECDFNRRLVAKFRVDEWDSFWGDGVTRMPDSDLYPPQDTIHDLCETITLEGLNDSDLAAVGEFMAAWTGLEQLLYRLAQNAEGKLLTIGRAIHSLEARGTLLSEDASTIEKLRQLRNAVVHGKSSEQPTTLREMAGLVRSIRGRLDKQSRLERKG